MNECSISRALVPNIRFLPKKLACPSSFKGLASQILDPKTEMAEDFVLKLDGVSKHGS